MESEGMEVGVEVRGAYKRYSRFSSPVLRGLDMTVPKGAIYGLLGPSGCGKTTLLSCIVGRSQLDAGSISVKVKSKADIGYMPQELALFTDYSIRDTLAYFGCVFGITGKALTERMHELLTFLELPSEESIIGQLSGGQQRRVSFCVALLHDPPVLILDEPTVGVDPVLSHSIWEKLVQMSAIGKKTIIITTHYIEEARSAHMIGLMRGGVLLAEDEPNKLIMTYNCDTLEQVFLRLSHEQSFGNVYGDDNSESSQSYPKPKKKPLPAIQDSGGISGKRVKAQFLKSYFWMKRNISIMLFLIILPFVQCTLFNLTVGVDPVGLKVAVVNEEPVPCTNLNLSSCGSEPLSCYFLNHLRQKDLNLVDYEDLESAKEAVKRNDAWGVVYFSHNYTDALMERLTLLAHATNLSIDLSEANVWMDMSNQYIGNMIKWDIFSGYLEFLKELFKTCGWPPKAGTIPVAFEKAVYGSNDPSFAHFAVPAILQLFEFYLPMMFTVGAIIMEKREGLLERSLVAGITLKETMIAHIVVQMVVLAVQTIIMLLVLFVMFDNPLNGSLILCLILLFLIGTNGMCYGFFVSTFCDTDTAATYMGLGSFFPLAMLSGMLWPFEGMHYLLRSIGIFLPLTLTTESMRSIMSRSWSITHPVVYRGFISVIGWIGFFSLCTFVLVKLQNGIKGGIFPFK